MAIFDFLHGPEHAVGKVFGFLKNDVVIPTINAGKNAADVEYGGRQAAVGLGMALFDRATGNEEAAQSTAGRALAAASKSLDSSRGAYTSKEANSNNFMDFLKPVARNVGAYAPYFLGPSAAGAAERTIGTPVLDEAGNVVGRSLSTPAKLAAAGGANAIIGGGAAAAQEAGTTGKLDPKEIAKNAAIQGGFAVVGEGVHAGIKTALKAPAPVFADYNPVTSEDVASLAKTDNVSEIKSTLDGKVPQTSLDSVAGAIAQTNDPNIIKNIITKANSNIPPGPSISDTAHTQTVKNGGTTIDTEGKVPGKGYAYAPNKGTEVVIPTKELTAQHFADFAKQHADQLSQPGYHLGSWSNPEDGNTYLDISKVGSPTAETIAEAQKGNQLAIYDLEHGKTIDIGQIDKNGVYSNLDEASRIHDQYQGQNAGAGGPASPPSAPEIPQGIPETGGQIAGAPAQAVDTSVAPSIIPEAPVSSTGEGVTGNVALRGAAEELKPSPTETLKVPTTTGGEVTKEVPTELSPDVQRAVDRATQESSVGSVDTASYKNSARGVKKLAADVRTNFSGEKNAQIQGAATLKDTLTKLAPDEQHGIFWYREVGGDLSKISAWLDDPKLESYHGEIQQALHLSPAAKEVSAALDQTYAKAGANAVEQGTLKGVLGDYNNARIYQQPDRPAGVSGILKQTTQSAKSRVYNNVAEAIENGHLPATTNAAEAAQIHLSELARVNTTRNLLNGMVDAKLGQWVDPSHVPAGFTTLEGIRNGAQVFATPAELANKLRAITEPDFVARVDGLRGIAAYQGLVKTVDLSFSLFHHLTEAAQFLYQTKGGLDLIRHAGDILKSTGSPEFQDVENNFVKYGGITTKVSDIQDVVKNLAGNEDKTFLGKLERAPGAKQVLQVANKSSAGLFDYGQRWIKTTDWQNKITTWVEKHPDATPEEFTKAAQGYAKEINAAYGGLNWEAIGVTRSAQRALRFVLLAPDWTISNLQLGKFALGPGTAGSAARMHLFTATTAGMVATQALNYSLTGHSSFQNPKGHEFEVEIAPNVYISFFKGGIGDLLKLGGNIQDKGVAQGTAQFAQGKLSPLARTTVGLASGTQFTGQNINNPNDSFAQKTLNEAKFIGTSALPIPFGVSSTAKYASDAKKTKQPINPLVAASLATGVSRFTKTSNGLSDKEQAYISLLQKKGASKQEINANTQFYLTLKKTSADKTKADKTITDALAKGDVATAQQAAAAYNKKLAASFKGWVGSFNQYSNKDLVKAYNARKIKLTTTSIRARVKSIKTNPLYAATTGGK